MTKDTQNYHKLRQKVPEKCHKQCHFKLISLDAQRQKKQQGKRLTSSRPTAHAHLQITHRQQVTNEQLEPDHFSVHADNSVSTQ